MASGFNGSVMEDYIQTFCSYFHSIISLGLSCDAFNYLNRGV